MRCGVRRAHLGGDPSPLGNGVPVRLRPVTQLGRARTVTSGATRRPSDTCAEKAFCSYGKTQAVYYSWHWGCMTPWAKTQVMVGVWTFPVVVTGVKGTATNNWKFTYRVDDPPCTVGTPC
ncbi:hypothetical protein CPE01_11060 [Cellulomonas persica]|uniref:Uncharacterized protein n=1 Tax=Cellulomonas persica TaxID=76861 RepID=A0A510URW7_9CELL|nr:hypothetical protein CPE01_11060 [Cellulomonas persica]